MEKNNPVNQEEIRDSKGRFTKGHSGNPTGKNAGRKKYVKALEDALETVATEKGESFLVNLVRRAYRSDSIAVALAKKLLPDQVHQEVTGDQAKQIVSIFYGDKPRIDTGQ